MTQFRAKSHLAIVVAGVLMVACTSVEIVQPGDGTPTPKPVASIGVTPGAFVLEVGKSRQMTAILRDADGNLLANRTVHWTTDDSRVTTINANGELRGMGHGYADVTAESEGKRSTVAVTVVPPESPDTLVHTQGSVLRTILSRSVNSYDVRRIIRP
jgi:uncharacterized protein YjdB